MLPSGLKVGDEYTQFPVVKDHLKNPELASSAYTFLSPDPTYTVLPSLLKAGDERTLNPVV